MNYFLILQGPSLSTKRGINLLEDSSGEGKQSNFERVHGNVLVVKKRVGEKTTSNGMFFCLKNYMFKYLI